ncbi:hypothetical protein Taro_004755 [Colocasia esculenta]|uniref:Trafficking protein particle complex subunit 8 n=1 Tax=Colocasia esculenta TaxID=4460 RepID=A0A843TMY1_COLES|nr:hypothetical protein [Colocasia esculenta]
MDRPATAPADSPLGRLLLEEITPVVMVLSTPLAEEACRKNGLDLVQMLRPFCSFQNIDVPVRTASEQPYRLQEFRLRMVYASKVRQMSPQVAEGLLRQVVSDANADLQPSVPQHEALVTAHDTECLPSWLQTFNRELLHTLSFSGHEAFDHPVACLLVVSTNDDKPINRFVDLFNTEQLPSLLNEGTMDPKILKRYLLLHDNQNGSQEKAGHILAEMRSTYGVHDSRLLCINSAQDMVWDEANNPWLNNKIGELTSRDVACFLSSDDLNEIRDFMQDLCSKCIIPHMEQKIRALNQQVSAIRKGFRNQIRNLWWRKGKEDTSDTPNGPMYTFSSIESQMRVLGDYAFMLRDYELALSNYRLLSTDYKLDKSWKHYAGAQEMVGLCLFMLDQSRKDSEYCMENAFHTYERTGSSVSRYATRCGIWWAEMLKIRSQHKEAASVYVRITDGEPSLHAAVILEQASYCYSFSNPPMLRKYGFHLVLAGNRYYISEEKKHAIRTYQSALSVYKGNSWSYINDHVHFNMGRWYAFLDMFDAAIEHMLEVLACSHQSMATQELFLGDFLRIVKSVGKKLEVPKLQLPHIDMSSLKIIFEDHRTYASSSAVDVGESLWQTLEEDMVPTTFTIKSNWLESSRKLRPLKKYNDASICVIGEPIKVYLEFTNPLKISLSVSDVSLICELSTSSAGSEVDENASATGAQGNVLLSGPSDNRELKSDDSSFDLSKINFVLGSAETRRVELDVTPKIQGFLKIVGVRWMFADSVVGYCNFNTDIKRKHGKARVIEDSSGSSLCFIVVKVHVSFIPFLPLYFVGDHGPTLRVYVQGLPKLEGYIHDLPKKTYAGDLRLLMLELQNQSEYSVKNLKMKISHPRFLTPGSSDNMNLKYPGCLEKQIDSKRMDVKESKVGKSSEKSRGLLFSFPNDIKIQGGNTFQWPLWLHSGIAGNVSLCISIYYEMENFSSDMSYRTLRMNYKLEVTECSSNFVLFMSVIILVTVMGIKSLSSYVGIRTPTAAAGRASPAVRPPPPLLPCLSSHPPPCGPAALSTPLLPQISDLRGSRDANSLFRGVRIGFRLVSPVSGRHRVVSVSVSPETIKSRTGIVFRSGFVSPKAETDTFRRVLPSLDISISITPYPSKLQEFLVRMDVVNKTNAESFLLRQLSTVAGEWDISTLPSHASNRPSQLLLAGQALLCFFKLKVADLFKKKIYVRINPFLIAEGFAGTVIFWLHLTACCVPPQILMCGVKSIDMHSSKGSDAILDSADSSEALIDNSRSPLADFHHHERLHQENFHQGRSSTVDLVLISQLVRSDPGEPPQLFSHHSCHCRVASKSPVWWLLDGPHTIHHDFASSFCEASLVMRIRNCAETAASVKIVTFDGPPLPGEFSDRQTGWHDVPLANDMKVGSEAQGTHLKKPSSGATPPFIWSGASSTRVSLEPDSTVEIPMHVCIFSAGIYDLSNYEVHWSLESSESDSSARDLRSSSGTSRGHPFYLTTLQTTR